MEREHTADATEHAASASGYELVTYAFDAYGYYAALLVDAGQWTVQPTDAASVLQLHAWRECALTWLTIPGARIGEYGPAAWPCVQHPDGRLAVLQL